MLMRPCLIVLIPCSLFATSVDDELRVLAKQCDASIEPRVVEVNKEYKTRLEGLQKRALAENDLTTAVAIRDELKALDPTSTRPSGSLAVTIDFAAPGSADKPPAPSPAHDLASASTDIPPISLVASGAEKLKKAVGRTDLNYWNGGEKPAPIAFNEDGSISRNGLGLMWRWQIASPTEFRLLLHQNGKDFGYRSYDFDPATGIFTYNKARSTRVDAKPSYLSGPGGASRPDAVETPFGKRVKEGR